MPAFKDITGQRFSRLVAITYKGKSKWLCRCDCGAEIVVYNSTILQNGHTTSCGCRKRDVTRERSLRHGHSRRGAISRAYYCWATMIQRCQNPKKWAFQYYGARGITVCKRWLAFENFLADMGEPPPRLTLDRIDNDGHYEPQNCRWVTWKQQRHNRSDTLGASY
jgi:hypothetical protein